MTLSPSHGGPPRKMWRGLEVPTDSIPPGDNVQGCNVYNGGFVYQRDTPRTRQCLAAWEAESSAENFTRYVKDQNALDQVSVP